MSESMWVDQLAEARKLDASELRRHASVGTRNGHECTSECRESFTCACLAVLLEQGDIWLVFRDFESGFKPVSEVLASHDAAWKWIQDHQGMSVDWAMRYEGYQIRRYGPNDND